MKSWTIARKVPFTIVIAAVFAALITGALSYVWASDELKRSAEEKLIALGASRTQAITDYLESIRQDLRFQAANPLVKKMIVEFDEGWDAINGDQTTMLQDLYIAKNPNPIGEKEKLDLADDGSAYSKIHGIYHPWMRTFLIERGYYDIFLFDPDGNLIYTVFKEADYATNVVSGKWKDTDLGNAFRAAIAKTSSGDQSFFDFKPYAPSNGAPASFISQSVTSENGDLLGVIAFQMPIDRINKVMQVSTGMGDSGETYLAGPDLFMRSDSRFSKESTILKTKVDSETVKLALAGKSGMKIVPDYRGVPVLSAYFPFTFVGAKWAIMSEIDEAEVFQPMKAMALSMALSTLVIVAAIAGFGVMIGRGISRPITLMTSAMSEIAEGNLEIDVPNQKRHDEVGEMASALQIFKDNAIEQRRLEEVERQSRNRAEERAKRITDMTSAFDDSVNERLHNVSLASDQMKTTAETLKVTASQTQQRTVTVTSTVEQTSANVQTVAAAADELSSSVSEINQQTARSMEVIGAAVSEAEAAEGLVRTLAQSAQRVGEVVRLITDIADQTNLLALNATIEAARAGEAGKGFAVVASEVKNLANQTAKATDEITGQINEIQDATENAVNAIVGIGKTISSVNEMSTAIAAAVEEQGSATQEIARNVDEAANGTREVSSEIVEVNGTAQETGTAADKVLDAATDMSDQSDALRKQIQSFLGDVRKLQQVGGPSESGVEHAG